MDQEFQKDLMESNRNGIDFEDDECYYSTYYVAYQPKDKSINFDNDYNDMSSNSDKPHPVYPNAGLVVTQGYNSSEKTFTLLRGKLVF